MEGAGQIIPGLENRLSKMAAGAKDRVTVAAADAYGEKDDQLVIKMPKSGLPVPTVKVGDRFRGGPDEHSPVFTVTAVTEAEVTLDGNHPLAGEDLTFDVEIVEIREATAQEKEHGHAHGPHGHDH